MKREEFFRDLAAIGTLPKGLPTLGGIAPNKKSDRQYVLVDNDQFVSYHFGANYTGDGVTPAQIFSFTAKVQNTIYRVKRMFGFYTITSNIGAGSKTFKGCTVSISLQSTTGILDVPLSLAVVNPGGATLNNNQGSELYYSDLNGLCSNPEREFYGLIPSDYIIAVQPFDLITAPSAGYNVACDVYISFEKLKN